METDRPLWRPLKNRRRALRLLVARLRDAPCQICGGRGDRHEFHHLAPMAKTMNIANAPRGTPTALYRELAYGGVVLLCPEHHRAVHAGEISDAGLAPLPVPSPDVWVAAGAFQWLYTYRCATSPGADPGAQREGRGVD